MSKFQQRHYEAIAEVIQLAKQAKPEYQEGMELLQIRLGTMFNDDNYLFNKDRFDRACVPGSNVKARTK